MPKYLVSTIEQVEREYVVEAKDEAAAFDAMTFSRFIRVSTPPYEKTRRNPHIVAKDEANR